MPIPIFVVNLAESTDRRQRVEQQLNTLGLQAEFFPAVRGSSLDQSELSRHYDSGKFFRPLSLSEIGCALSHALVYRLIVDRNIGYALVLEDDVLLSKDLPKVLNSLEPHLKPQVPEVTLLISLREFADTHDVPLGIGKYRIVPVIRAGCAHGYVVTNAAARALFENFYPISKPADWWELAQKVVTVTGIDPFVIGWDTTSNESLLALDRSKTRQTPKTLGYYYKKAQNRLSARLLWLRLRWKYGVLIRALLGKSCTHARNNSFS
jgi:glycosyl transferase, family 25